MKQTFIALKVDDFGYILNCKHYKNEKQVVKYLTNEGILFNSKYTITKTGVILKKAGIQFTDVSNGSTLSWVIKL